MWPRLFLGNPLWQLCSMETQGKPPFFGNPHAPGLFHWRPFGFLENHPAKSMSPSSRALRVMACDQANAESSSATFPILFLGSESF